MESRTQLKTICKVNSVQEAYAKCFAVDISKFEIKNCKITLNIFAVRPHLFIAKVSPHYIQLDPIYYGTAPYDVVHMIVNLGRVRWWISIIYSRPITWQSQVGIKLGKQEIASCGLICASVCRFKSTDTVLCPNHFVYLDQRTLATNHKKKTYLQKTWSMECASPGSQ